MKENVRQHQVETMSVSDIKESFNKGREKGEEIIDQFKGTYSSFFKKEARNKRIMNHLVIIIPSIIISGGLMWNIDNRQDNKEPLVYVKGDIYKQGNKFVDANEKELHAIKIIGYRYNVTDGFYNEVVDFEKRKDGEVVIKIERRSQKDNKVIDTFYFSEAGIDVVVSTKQGFHGEIVVVDGQAFWVSEFGKSDEKVG